MQWSLKCIEVIGQILRNRHGVMEKNKLVEMFQTAYELGLRLLSNVLQVANNHEQLFEEIMQSLEEEDDSLRLLSKDEIRRRIARFLASLFFGTSRFVLWKLSKTLGSDKLIDIANEAHCNIDSTASKLLTFSIRIWFTKKLHIEDVKNLKEELHDNPFALRMLNDIVVEYLYLHDVDHSVKQRIAHVLKIPLSTQTTIQHIKQAGEQVMRSKSEKHDG